LTIEDLLARFVGQSLAKLRACSMALSDREATVDWDRSVIRVDGIGDVPVEVLASSAASGDDFRWGTPVASRLRAYAVDNGIAALAEPSQYAGEISSYELAFVGCGVLDAPGLLVFERDGRAVFVIVPHVNDLALPARDANLMAEAIAEMIETMEPPDPRAYVGGLLNSEGWSTRNEGATMLSSRGGESIRCTFDLQGRLARVDVLTKGST
jgi:hypothetical protein